MISEGDIKGALWSLSVLDSDGLPVLNLNENKFIAPASNLKLYTLGAILSELGGDYTYKTNILGKGELIDSTWIGDLIIVGKGDPSISGDLYENDRYFVFTSLLKQLKSVGISKIDGDIIAHNGFFDEEKYPKGWDWDDLSFYYGVEIDALSYNNNAIDIEVRADGAVGEKPRLDIFPENIEGIEFINDQVIDEPGTKYDEYYRREMGKNVIHLRSSLPQGYFEEESLSIYDAPRYFIKAFQGFLAQNGIEVNNRSDEISVINYNLDHEYRLLASHESKPLSELMKWAMKESDNFYTEMFLKTLAAEKHSNPGSFDEGILLIRKKLADMNVDTNLVFMKDGSGMASGNLTTTGNIAKYLHSFKTNPEYASYRQTLSIGGIDGTLKYRFKSSSVYKKFIGKSGYVGGVRTLSGYLRTKSGAELTISIATNHFTGKVRPVDDIHESILEYLVEKY